MAQDIRRFDPATGDYEALAALWSADHPDMPREASIWRSRDAEPQPGIEPWGRAVAYEGDTLVGIAEFCGCPVAGEPGQLQLGFALAPDAPAGTLDRLYAHLEARMQPHEPPALVGYVRDTHPHVLAFFERHGFASAQQTASSELRAPFADDARLDGVERALAGHDLELVTAAALARESEDWARPYHALEVEVVNDIPFLGPTRPEPFEVFLDRCRDPDRFDPGATFVARSRADGELVGVSLLHTFASIPGYAFAGLTGVRRPWRRRGIARALKQATLAHARERGLERIVTLNDVDNPMLRLNEALGFRRSHIQHTMLRRGFGSS